MSSNYEVWSYLLAGLSVLRGLAILAGLIICIRHRFLSPWMYLMLLGFTGWGAAAGFSVAFPFLVRWISTGNTDAIMGLNAVAQVGSLLATVAVVVGLGGVLGDLRRWITQLRELAEEQERTRIEEAPR